MNKKTLEAIRALSNIEGYLRKDDGDIVKPITEQIDIVMDYLCNPDPDKKDL